jgi:hypothetical protein
VGGEAIYCFSGAVTQLAAPGKPCANFLFQRAKTAARLSLFRLFGRRLIDGMTMEDCSSKNVAHPTRQNGSATFTAFLCAIRAGKPSQSRPAICGANMPAFFI